VIDFPSLIPLAAAGAAVLAIGLGLRVISRWSPGTSLSDTFGGDRDPPWPRGVQEEEPVRWNLAAIGPRTRHARGERSAAIPDPNCTTPCRPTRQAARPLA